MKRALLALALVLAGCQHTPEPHDIYQRLQIETRRVEVIYVGRNWEIKNAAKANKFPDAPAFHEKRFWAIPNNQKLVVYFNNENRLVVLDLEEFEKEFKCISD